MVSLESFFFRLIRFIIFMAVTVLIITAVLFTFIPKDELVDNATYFYREWNVSPDSNIIMVHPSLSSDQKPLTFNVSDAGDLYDLTYYWSYGGYPQSYQAQIPKEMYNYYKSRPHDRANYQEYALSDYDREIIQNFAYAFRDHGSRHNYTKDQVALNIISFVNTLPYSYDSDSTGFDEYPRYPIETLVEGGDCEDRAILIASMLYELDQNTALIHLEGHVAIGLEDNGNYTGQYYESGGVRYYYAEVGENGPQIGVISNKINPKFRAIHPVVKVPSVLIRVQQFNTGINSSGGYSYTLYGTVKNDGPGELKNASLRVVVNESDHSNAVPLPNFIAPLGDFSEDYETKFEFVISVPRGSGSVKFYLEGDNIEPIDAGGFYFSFS